MPLIATDDTTVYQWKASAAAFESLGALPAGVSMLSKVRPTAMRLNGQFFLAGQTTRLLLVGPDRRLSIGGLRAPTKAPAISGGGGTGVTGDILGRFTFRQKLGARVLQESNPSAQNSFAVGLTNMSVVVGNLPTSQDPHATHLAYYESRDGSPYCLAFERPVGVLTNVEHSLPSAFLFEQPTLPVIPGTEEHDYSARGVLPYATAGVLFHQKAWYVVPGYRGWFYSRTNEPFAVSPLSFVPTRDGELPVGIGVASDGNLLGFCRRCVYAIEDNRSEGDVTVDKISSDFGLVSPWSLLDLFGRTVFAAESGMAQYLNGSFRSLMADSFAKDWQRLYAANPQGFEAMLAQNDRLKGNIKLLIPQADAPHTMILKGRYSEMVQKGYSEPFWSIDLRDRLDTTFGEYTEAGERRAFPILGSEDGRVRQDDPTNGDDDGDAYNKALSIVGPHDCDNDQGGDDAHGYQFTNLDLFVKNDQTEVQVSLHTGDDTASQGVAPFTEPLAASAVPGQVGKTSHHLTVEGAAGKGGALRLAAQAPVGVEYRGHNLYHRKGEQTRPPTS